MPKGAKVMPLNGWSSYVDGINASSNLMKHRSGVKLVSYQYSL